MSQHLNLHSAVASSLILTGIAGPDLVDWLARQHAVHILIHRQPTRCRIHQMPPLTTFQFVILFRQRLDLLVCPMALRRIGEYLPVHRRSGIDRIHDTGKEGIAKLGSDMRTTLYHPRLDTLEGCHASGSLSGCQRNLGHRRQTTRILLLVQFHLRPARKLRTTLTAQAEELPHGRIETTARLLTKLTTEPVPIMVTDSLCTDTVDVPSHIEEEFQVVACHLHIVHVGYPELAHIVVVGLAHLVVDKSGLGGGQPEVVVRTSPVAEMIIDTSPTLSLLLAGI